MNEQLYILNEETRQRLINNLRKTQFDLQKFGLDLEAIVAEIEKDIREQKLRRFEKVKASQTP